VHVAPATADGDSTVRHGGLVEMMIEPDQTAVIGVRVRAAIGVVMIELRMGSVGRDLETGCHEKSVARVVSLVASEVRVVKVVRPVVSGSRVVRVGMIGVARVVSLVASVVRVVKVVRPVVSGSHVVRAGIIGVAIIDEMIVVMRFRRTKHSADVLKCSPRRVRASMERISRLPIA
jgi:hypothetical protein